MVLRLTVRFYLNSSEYYKRDNVCLFNDIYVAGKVMNEDK